MAKECTLNLIITNSILDVNNSFSFILKEYDNSYEESSIEKFYLFLDGQKSRMIIKYKESGELKSYGLNNIVEFLNLTMHNPKMAISATEEIIKDLNGLVFKNENENEIFNFNRDMLDSLSEQAAKVDLNGKSDELTSLLSIPLRPMEWFAFPSNFQIIAQTAFNFLKTHPDSRTFSLGQSPAWIVEAAKLIDPKGEFGVIPFSGNYVIPQNDEKEENLIFKLSSFSPYTENTKIELYQKLLTDLHLSPEEIIDKFLNDKKPTNILEFTLTGGGLASFVYLLFKWAEKESQFDIFKEALRIVILDDCLEDSGSKITINIEDVSIKCEHFLVENIPGADLMWQLANGVDTGSESDRLVPSYPHSIWENLPPILNENADHINNITALLKEAVTPYIVEYEALGLGELNNAINE